MSLYWRDELLPFDVTSFLQKGPDEWKRMSHHMRKTDLIEAAFKSPEFRDVIKTQKIDVDSLCWEFTTSPQIKVTFVNSYNARLIINSKSIRKSSRPSTLIDPSELVFRRGRPRNQYGYENGYDMKYTDTITSKKLSMFEMMEMMTNVLLEVLEVKNFQFIWYKQTIPGMKDLFVWDKTRNFEKIKISPSKCDTVQEISSFLTFVMEDVTTEKLIVKMDHDDVRCKIPFKQNKISITSNIFPMECFTSMECKEATLDMKTWSWTEINTLIKFWILGGLPYLKHLIVDNIRTLGNREDFFTGITAIPTERRPPLPSGVMIPSLAHQRRFDIFRQTDHKMALIVFDRALFHFYNWDGEEEKVEEVEYEDDVMEEEQEEEDDEEEEEED